MQLHEKSNKFQHFSYKELQKKDINFQKTHGISATQLMEIAGYQTAYFSLQQYKNISNYFIFCGRGHNGGDGLVTARHLHLLGKNVHVVLSRPKRTFSGLNKKQLTSCEKLSIPITNWKSFDYTKCNKHSIVIDALTGIGLNKPINSQDAKHIRTLNNTNAHILSVDVPSGLCCPHHQELFIKSNTILTFEYLKTVFLNKQLNLNNIFLVYIGLNKKTSIQPPAPFTKIIY